MSRPPTKFTEEIKLILSQCGITNPPVDLGKVASNEGLTYTEYLSPYEFEAMILRLKGQAHAIVNTSEAEPRRRFTLAYILYYYIYCDAPVWRENKVRPRFPKFFPTYYRLQPWSKATASLFAIELLVPYSMLRKHFRASANARDVARLFRVSVEVAKFAISYHFASLFPK